VDLAAMADMADMTLPADMAPAAASMALSPEEDLPSGLLWRPNQDVDVLLPAVPLGQTLSIELWADGSQEKTAGNAVRFELQADGTARFSLRFGSQVTSYASEVQPTLVLAGAPLRLRMRRDDTGTTATLYVDTQSGTAWVQEQARFGFDYTRFFGRRTLLLQGPAGTTPTVQPIAPPEAFSFNRTYEALVDWKVFQRRGTAGDIPLSIFYRSATAATLAVQVLSADASLVIATVQGSSMRAAPQGRGVKLWLRGVPTGGNYQLKARLSAESGPLGEDTVHDIAVGDVFLSIGQSNMAGFASLTPAEPPVPQVHAFGNDYIWRQAAEPMDGWDNQVDEISEEDAQHSLMLRFGKEAASAAGVPVAIIPGPRYGTNIDYDWARPAADPQDRSTLYGSALYRTLSQDFGAPIRGVLWYQGEGNAGSGVDNYRTMLAALMRALRSDLGSNDIFVANCQLSTIGTNQTFSDINDFMQVQEAQREYAAQDPLSLLVTFVDLPRQDEYHLDNPGVREAGRRLGVAVGQALYGKPAALGPVLRSAQLVAGQSNQVALTYDKAVQGGTAALYRLVDAQGSIQPSSVSVIGAQVLLTLPRATALPATLSYGYSSDDKAPWVRGADGAGGALVFQNLPLQ
jgi:hypothetical protein